MEFLNFPDETYCKKCLVIEYPSRWLNYQHVNFKTLYGTQVNSYHLHTQSPRKRLLRRLVNHVLLLCWPLWDWYQLGNSGQQLWTAIAHIIKICRGCLVSEWSDLHLHVQAKKIMHPTPESSQSMTVSLVRWSKLWQIRTKNQIMILKVLILNFLVMRTTLTWLTSLMIH